MGVEHVTVMLHEAVDALDVQPNGVYVDGTFGRGGHSRLILSRLSAQGQLWVFDKDPRAIAVAQALAANDARVHVVHDSFISVDRYLNANSVNGVLLDLGVSSPQIDDAERGFSFRFDGPLDMRMNRYAKITAKDIINQYNEKQLSDIFYQYSEIHNSNKLASLIVRARNAGEIDSIGKLVTIIDSCIPADQQNKYLAKVFQALRIEVNKEMSGLKALLLQAGEVIGKNGRMAVISYHSNEDRLVKNYFKTGNFEGKQDKDIYGNCQTPFKTLHNKVIVPEEQEMEHNPRSRSAKLRIAQKN